MASNLELELAKLKNAIIKMINLAENQVFEAVGVLLNEPISKKKTVKKTEEKIDKLDLKIEEICQNIFALQQPVASDLRFIMSSMNMTNEVERIGDLSMSIIKLSKNINEKHDLISKVNITSISRDIETVVIKTNMCFQTLNEKAIDEIFELNSSIKLKVEEAIQNTILEMKDNSKKVVSGTNLVMVLKHFDRIGEHCTNVAESVHFMIHAKTIRHEKRKT
jgi:phosphate transport system protein